MEQQQQQQQPEAPSLSTLPGNILQDIATRLDGHSLLALLRICRTLRNSHALRGSLLEAVLQQLDTLRAAVQAMMDAVGTAQALQQHVESLREARPPVIGIGTPAVGQKALQLAFGAIMLGVKLVQERPGLKAEVVAVLDQVQVVVQLAKAEGHSGQQALAVGQLALGVQAAGRSEQAAQTAGQWLEQQQPQAAGQPGLLLRGDGEQHGQGVTGCSSMGRGGQAVGQAVQRPQVVRQDLGTIVMKARELAVGVLDVQQAGPEWGQFLQSTLEANGLGHLVDVRAVTKVLLEGQDVQQVVAQIMCIVEQTQQAGLVVLQEVQQAAPAGQQAVPAVQQPVQQAAPAGQQAVPAVQQPVQQAAPAGQQAVPAVQQPVQQAEPAGQQLGEQPAQQARQALPVGAPARQPALQAALHALLAGQPEAGLAVQAAVQARAQLLVQLARQTLQDWVRAGQAVLRVGHHHDEDMSALEATVQAAQQALQA